MERPFALKRMTLDLVERNLRVLHSEGKTILREVEHVEDDRL